MRSRLKLFGVLPKGEEMIQDQEKNDNTENTVSPEISNEATPKVRKSSRSSINKGKAIQVLKMAKVRTNGPFG